MFCIKYFNKKKKNNNKTKQQQQKNTHTLLKTGLEPDKLCNNVSIFMLQWGTFIYK